MRDAPPIRWMRSTTAAVAVTAVATLSACTPAPAPSPTPTAAFASEEEAFAAAEAVYRAYNDAGNARRAGAPDADPQQYLTGIALEGDIDTQNLLLSSGLRATGSATLDVFVGESADLWGDVATVTGTVCVDVSDVLLLDKSGADVTPADRGDKIAQRVTFLSAGGPLLISSEATPDSSAC